MLIGNLFSSNIFFLVSNCSFNSYIDPTTKTMPLVKSMHQDARHPVQVSLMYHPLMYNNLVQVSLIGNELSIKY